MARVHASIHWYVGAHRIASFQPRNGSPRLHVLITQYAPLLQCSQVHPPWYPVLCHGVVGVYTVRHGPHRSIVGIYGLGQRILPAMKRISSPARTFLNGGCPTLSNILLNPCRKMERMQVWVPQDSSMTHTVRKYHQGQSALMLPTEMVSSIGSF